MGLKLNLIFLLIAIGAYPSHAERISEQKCREYGQAVLKKQVIPSPLPGGRPTVVNNSNCQHQEVPLIFGGTKASRHEFPHQALLGYKHLYRRGTFWLCGGSLISPQFIMSAAHCRQPEDFTPVKYVKVGMNKQSESSRIYNVERIHAHRGYNARNFNNDIQILKLTEEVQMNEFVMPICLPTKQHDDSKAVVSGFGSTAPGNYPDDLLKVTVQRFAYEECRRTDGFMTRDTKLCYGHRTESKDSCDGDSGGPLQVYNDANVPCTYTQIGIVSYGPMPCGIPNEPGAYTNVYHYLEWIEGIVWGDSSDSSNSEE